MNDFVREFFEDQPELLRRYERNEARYILQLPKNYDTISIDFGIDKNEMKRLVIALAEFDLTIDEWLCFKMKELILADRLSKENRGEELGIMRYYVISDVHGYYTQMKSALEKAGFFSDTTPHKLIMLGDLFDRGHEAKQLQQFILEQMEQDKIILIRGNHEDLFVELVTTDAGMPYSYHKSNGTYDTALQLTGFDPVMASIRHYDFADAAKDTPFYKEIIPAMLDYFETEHYVFTHGWIPSIPNRDKSYSYISSWREAGREQWNQARWFNGMDAAQTADENKTIVCGHWHTSYGHSKYEHKGTEFGEDADFSPYYGPGIIAIDACTAFSGKVNCLAIED